MQTLDKYAKSDGLIISGGTGLIGSAIAPFFTEKGYKVKILTRNPKRDYHFHWDPEKKIFNAEVLHNSTYWIHLSGESIAKKRWSKKRKKELKSSRIISTDFVNEVLTKNKHEIQHLLYLSGSGYYGFEDNKIHTEEDPSSNCFLGELCDQWEKSMYSSMTKVQTVSILRPGMVLSNAGGAFTEIINKRKFGVMGIPSKGEQIIPWIHIDDLVIMINHLIQNKIGGIYNATASSNTSFCELAENINSQSNYRLPMISIAPWIMKIIFGELSDVLCLSQRLSNEKIVSTGYTFKYTSIEKAIQSLIKHD